MQPHNSVDLQPVEPIIFEDDSKSELISTETKKNLTTREDREPDRYGILHESISDSIENCLEQSSCREEAKDSEQLDNASVNKSLIVPTPIKLPGTAENAVLDHLRDILIIRILKNRIESNNLIILMTINV